MKTIAEHPFKKCGILKVLSGLEDDPMWENKPTNQPRESINASELRSGPKEAKLEHGQVLEKCEPIYLIYLVSFSYTKG